MSSFSPSEAAFEGFRLIGRRPGAIVAWSLLHLLMFAVVLGLVWLLLAPDLPSMLAQIAAAKAAAGGGAPDATWAAPLALKMRALQWILQPVGVVFGAVFTCAIYRALQRPQDSGFAYLRFGGDELRLIALGIVYFILIFVVVVALVIVGALVGTILYLSVAKNSPGSGGWVALIVVVLSLAAICLSIWIAVRLSLAWPISFAEKRLAIFDSWRLTRGVFWRMLGAYLLTFIFILIFSLAVMAVIGVMALIGIFAFAGAMQGGAPDWSRLAPVVTLLAAIWAVTASVLSAMTRAVITAPSMSIYAALTQSSEDDAVPAPPRSAGLVL